MQIEITIFQLLLSLFLGMLVGLERILTKHDAGVRTYGLVSMGACLFMISSMAIGVQMNAPQEILRVVGQIVTGIGFIGAGLIFMSEKEHRRVGLTSAACMWVSAGVGIACGMGLYQLAIISTILTLFALTIMWHIEYWIVKKINGDKRDEIMIEKVESSK
jgi:putative Mg2+ transporter-C (MgtC) family protein